jgi:hypothetical protein
MPKVSFAPGELIGTIRFIFDKTKTRTLNATQAYDTNPSQIVLGSFPASASKKLLTKDLGAIEPGTDLRGGTASVVVNNAAGQIANTDRNFKPENTDRQKTLAPSGAPWIWTTVSFGTGQVENKPGLKKSKRVPFGDERVATASFSGVSPGSSLFPGDPKNSNETKEIYYGAFTVGTGEYREWQGKYAVLKVDLLTNNAILRVYNQ